MQVGRSIGIILTPVILLLLLLLWIKVTVINNNNNNINKYYCNVYYYCVFERSTLITLMVYIKSNRNEIRAKFFKQLSGQDSVSMDKKNEPG